MTSEQQQSSPTIPKDVAEAKALLWEGGAIVSCFVKYVLAASAFIGMYHLSSDITDMPTAHTPAYSVARSEIESEGNHATLEMTVAIGTLLLQKDARRLAEHYGHLAE